MKKFLCGVTFQHELGYTDVYFYDTVEALKEASAPNNCYLQCGIVEVEFDGPNDPTSKEEVKSYRWVEKQDMRWGDRS